MQITTIVNSKNVDVPVNLFGTPGQDFDSAALDQIFTAAKLPVAETAALMPDAHLGYGLPIGGIVALNNAISPNFVGVDIACRMCLTILDMTPELIGDRKKILQIMRNVSRFGIGSKFEKGKTRQHEVMADPLWDEIPLLKENRATAQMQLGSSGGGNHFFNLMIGKVLEDRTINNKVFLKGTQFVAIMTHSGSRGIGHKSAKHYSNQAVDFIKARSQIDAFYRGIPKGYEFLPLETEQGEEYWKVMQLMGGYASANHNLIHDHFLKEMGCRSLIRIENHHNFAWEKNGIYIHRKGATPSGAGEIGIIPGSMGTNSYVVAGKGNFNSIESSSHGAGRVSSRTQAKKNLDRTAFKQLVEDKDIVTAGVATDETNQAYKDIERVIQLQVDDDVLTPIFKMIPKIVIMGNANKRNNELDRVVS